ncbi:MAG: PD-(D/E)XK nuclease family protein [Candidatus Dormibacteria bacterium]
MVGPTRLVGGPGGGNTQTVVELAVRWLRTGQDPHRLVVVTRSHTSARDLRGRIETRLPAVHPKPRVMTHEGLARTVLADAAVAPELTRGLGRIGEWLAMREALRRALPLLSTLRPLADDPACVEDSLEFVSMVKQSLVGAGLLAERLRDEHGLLPELAVVAACYETVLGEMGTRDTRDLVADALACLEQAPSVMANWADLLLVDEAEDLTPAQWYLLRELANRLSTPRRALLAGDLRLAVPAFRGPSSRFFEEVFPREITPEEWVLPGSTPAWVERLSDSLGVPPGAELSGDGLRPALRAQRPSSALGLLWVASDETEEAFAVAREIQRSSLDGEVAYDQVAVLVRSPASQLAPLVEAMSAIGVPYHLERSRWTASLAVHLVSLWLRALCNPHDEEPLLRLLAEGPHAAPPEELIRLRRLAARRQETLARTVWREAEGADEDGTGTVEGEPTEGAPGGLVVARCWRRLGGGNPDLAETEMTLGDFRSVLADILTGSGLAGLALTDPDTAAALARLNLGVDDAAAARARMGFPEASLREWQELLQIGIRRAGWDTEKLAQDGSPEVSLLTIHQAKGRRWRRVFIIGLADGIFPLRSGDRGLLGPDDTQRLLEVVPELEDALGGPGHRLDQERRLLLVGATRATEKVVFSWAQRYLDRPAEPSPFVAHLLRAGLSEQPAPSAHPVTAMDCLAGLAIARARDLREAPVEPTAGALGLGDRALELRESLAPWDPVTAVAAGADLELSPTSLRAWLACPRLFYYHRLRLRQPDALPLVLGTAAHRLLDLVQQRLPGGADQMAFTELAAGIVAGELMPTVRARLLDPLGALYVESWLNQLIARWGQRVIGPGTAVVGAQLASEVAFRLAREGWSLVGQIDALWRHPDGELEVVDYKTTSADPPSERALRTQVFGQGGDGPTDWQLPIYTLAAGEGGLADLIGSEVPALARNWYLGLDSAPSPTAPVPARGFRIDAESDPAGKGEARLGHEELEWVRQELDHQVAVIQGGLHPAQPRHDTRTCRAFGGCALSFCCDGEGTVGGGLSVPGPRP